MPLSQAILLDAFPKEKHGQALAIFGLGIMVAPVLGPTFGGWLTDTFVWRAVFYINVPIGLFALLLAMGNLPRADIRYLKTDWIGLVLLVLAVGSLQMVLDQGQTRDWFNSRFIQFFTAIAVFASVAFFMRGWNNPKNIVDLSLLKDRNFLAGLLAITAYGVTLFGTIALLPLLTQRLMGYPAMNAGMLFIPRAVASAIALSITGNYLMLWIDSRILVAGGGHDLASDLQALLGRLGDAGLVVGQADDRGAMAGDERQDLLQALVLAGDRVHERLALVGREAGLERLDD